MTKLELIIKSSKLLRDESNTIYSKSFIGDQINEAIDRTKQLVPELRNMTYLLVDTDSLVLMPEEYQHLISIYACARCYEVDERHYEANKYMNEFEIKINNIRDSIASGELIITDPNTGLPVVIDINQDYVRNVYFADSEYVSDAETIPVM